ncbi:MAG: AsmA family protein [candidate division Zixibacteria bacterium]|nr:AsmA family protein [candidate division Zixibacteria bacterium]
MKKLFKILLWLAGIFIALVIVAIIGLKLFFPKEKAKAYAIEEGSAALGRPLAVEDIDISIWGGLGIKLVNVTIGNPEGFKGEALLKAEDIDLKLRLLPLLKKDIRISRLIIEKPQVALLKRADGSNNFTFAAVGTALPAETAQKVPAEARAASAAISFDKFEINNGQVLYVDDSSQIQLKLDRLNLATSLQNPRANYYLSEGNLQADRIELTLEEPYPAYAITVKYRASYNLNENLLTLESTDLTLNGLKFKLSGTLNKPMDTMVARINVKSDKIAVVDLFKLLPKGQLTAVKDFKIEGGFSFNADLEYNAALEKEAFKYNGSATISDMVMAKKDIPGQLKFRRALIDFAPDNLRMAIEEGTFDSKPFKGHVLVKDFENPMVNGELAGNFNLVFLEPFLPAESSHKVTGESSFDIKFSGPVKDYKNMKYSGTLAIVNGTYNSGLLPEPVEAFELDMYFDRDLVNVKKFNARTTSGNLSFTGRVNNLIPYFLADSAEALKIHPAFDGDIKGNLNLALLNDFLPDKGHPELKGKFALDVNVNGTTANLARLKVRGTASVTEASYTDSLLPEPIQHLAMDMTLKPDTIGFNRFDVKFVSSDVSINGRLINPFPYLLPMENIDRSKVAKPNFLFELSSHYFDTDKLFPEAVPGSAPASAAGATGEVSASLDSVSMVFVPDIDGQGTFKVDTLIYSKVEFTQINGKLKIKDRKITAYDASGKVYSGDVTGETTIDLNDFEKPRYSGQFRATKVEVDDFITRFSKFGGHVFGKVDLTGSYDAVGWEAEEFLNSLNMNGVGTMQEGKLVTSGAVYSVISGLAEKAGQTFDKEQALKNLKSNIIVKDGKVYLDNLKAKLGNLGDMELGGYYGFNDEISYTGSILLSEATTKDLMSKGGLLGGLTSILSNKTTTRLQLPIKVVGTVDKPQAEIDYSAMAEKAGDNLKDGARNLLDGLIKKK